jgi:flagellar L-ring protein precursor FlgH
MKTSLFTCPSNAGRSRTAVRFVLLASAALALSGCANFLDKLSEVGQPPRESAIKDPTRQPGYTPVSMPMPSPMPPQAGTNSLWRPGAKAFFKDQRASDVGDLITVTVNINESGQLSNKTQTSTANSEAANANTALFGLQNSLKKLGADPANLWSFGSTSGINGTGTSARSEQVVINLAATVTQKLPNGNLVIMGRQELRVNGDLRELSVQGIIRAEDISTLNTINLDQIAEARVVYGGRGTLADIQQARYGQQLFDLISPF